MGDLQPYLTIRSLSGGDGNSLSSADSAYASGGSDYAAPSTTHDISRVNYHVKHLDSFAKTLEDSASRAFPNRGRAQQRYNKVVSLLLHWKSDDLFVLPELQDLETCFREDYGFETETFPIPSENAHLELMLKLGAMIKDHEAADTLFIVYYGGHARIDESRQSTWCATRNPNSPWLQWSAIQTLLERSASDTLILLDCCAGAASATFPNGKSITETISASSWDAIAPDPGRYSFTSALIEVLQEWRLRAFSAAMLHAEILARLKHPRPITVNGRLFEARSTPVHFMMTANHRAPSIEIGRILPKHRQLPSPPADPIYDPFATVPVGSSGASYPTEPVAGPSGGRGPLDGQPVNEPNEDEPHVMISLALEDDQELDLNAWEQWLSSFPALAKYVKVQGVFKSHSTLLLLSLPVMVWDLLPENQACSFVAFIRSNNLLKEEKTSVPESVPVPEQAEENTGVEDDDSAAVEAGYVSDEDGDDDTVSLISGITFTGHVPSVRMSIASTAVQSVSGSQMSRLPRTSTLSSTTRSFRRHPPTEHSPTSPTVSNALVLRDPRTKSQCSSSQHSPAGPSQGHGSEQSLARPLHAGPHYGSNASLPRTMVLNQQRVARRARFDADDDNESPRLAQHIVDRLEEYFQRQPNPTVGITEFFASNLGVETRDIGLWFHRRRQQELTTRNLQSLRMDRSSYSERMPKNGAKMILPGLLNKLLEIFPPSQLLFVDLRSPTNFDKSHIYGAINLRVPVSFVEHGYDLLSLAFTDDQSRRNFARASTSRCIIFYDQVSHFPWECPVAEPLIKQLRVTKGWTGDYYVLKGHYREFSSSFDKYIAGDKMTKDAKDYIDGLRQRLPSSRDENAAMEEQYGEWKDLVENENRVPMADSLVTRQDERRQAVEEHQASLEAELERRNPVLYRKALGLQPMPLRKDESPVYYDVLKKETDGYLEKEPRAELVEPLARGLEKMHGESSYNMTTPGYDKLAELGEAPASSKLSDEFDEIDPRGEMLQDDPAFMKAGGLGGRSAANARSDSRSPDPRRARERPFWKRLRTTK